MTPVVSVCIANYNGIGLIDTCIESVLAQNGHLPVEILVHDDASTDGSAAHIRARYPNVTLLDSEENVGFCIANNRMAAMARGEYLLLLNNDATLMDGALQILHDEASRIARPAILSLPQYDFDSGEIVDRGCLLDLFFNPIPNLDAERRDVAMGIGACLWIPRNVWEELGGFPEWFESIGEDLYLCCRARLLGFPILISRASGYRHKIGQSFGGGKPQASGLSTTRRRRSLSERNKTFAMIICQPLLLIVLLLPVHILLIHLEGVFLAAFKRDTDIWLKIYAPLLPGLWAKRKELKVARNDTQSRRTLSTTAWLKAFRWLPRKLQMLMRYGIPDVR